MGRDRDDFSGRFTPEYTDEEFVATVNELGSCPTSEVAEVLGCSSNLAYRRLRDLADTGEIGSEKVAGNYRWFVDEN